MAATRGRSLGALLSGKPETTYAVASGVSTFGAAFGFLGATGLATAAGAPDRGAIAVGALIALFQVSAATATPYAAHFCRDTSVRVVFARVQCVSAGLWFGAGVALLLGAASLPVLMVAAVPIGFANGLMTVLRPILAKCYFGSQRMSGAVATMSVVVGVAWGAGALLGGSFFSTFALGWGLVIYAVCALGLASTVYRVGPRVEAAIPIVAARPWRTAWANLKDNHVVRWSALLGVAGALFITPIAGLVVPIADEFRPGRPISGASFLMASFSVGQLCSPLMVRRLALRRTELSAAAFVTLLCGASLVTLAIVSVLLAHVTGELAIWVVIGVAFGATRFAAGALYFGAAAESGPAELASRNLATVTLSSLLMAPLGVLACSAVLGGFSAYVAVVGTGAGAMIVGLFVLGALRRIATSD